MSTSKKEENGHPVIIKDEPADSGELDKEQSGDRVRNFVLCAGFITMELGKQISAFGSSQFNGGRHLIHASTIVALIELVKLCICVCLFSPKKELTSLKFTWNFLIPAFMYGVTNNLFLYTMNVTPPPLWNTLIQTRVIMTVVIYRIVFKKGTTPMRGLAMFILILGITLAALSGSSTGRSVQEPTMRIVIRAVVLSLVSSALSSATSVYTEYLYKKNNGPSMQHQVQMYLFSVGMTTVWSLYITKGHPFAIHGRVSVGRILLIFATVILCSVGSLLLPAIVKKMDSIVKVYSSVATIVLMAFLCTWLFPKSFQLNLPYLAAILIILASSVMYERAKPKDAPSEKLVTLSSGDALSLDPEKIL